jgi:hypothetical protein
VGLRTASRSLRSSCTARAHVRAVTVPTSFTAMGLIVVALACGGLALLVAWLRRRRASAALSEREPLDDDAIYARCYAGSQLSRALVQELWHEVALHLQVPASRLRPDDRFGREIGIYVITSEALDVLAARGRERAKALGVSIDLQNLNTVDDYVRCFGAGKH